MSDTGPFPPSTTLQELQELHDRTRKRYQDYTLLRTLGKAGSYIMLTAASAETIAAIITNDTGLILGGIAAGAATLGFHEVKRRADSHVLIAELQYVDAEHNLDQWLGNQSNPEL